MGRVREGWEKINRLLSLFVRCPTMDSVDGMVGIIARDVTLSARQRDWAVLVLRGASAAEIAAAEAAAYREVVEEWLLSESEIVEKPIKVDFVDWSDRRVVEVMVTYHCYN
jgi:hypothetical protein